MFSSIVQVIRCYFLYFWLDDKSVLFSTNREYFDVLHLAHDSCQLLLSEIVSNFSVFFFWTKDFLQFLSKSFFLHFSELEIFSNFSFRISVASSEHASHELQLHFSCCPWMTSYYAICLAFRPYYWTFFTRFSVT